MQFTCKTTCLSIVTILLLVNVTSIGLANEEDQISENITTLVFSVPDLKIIDNDNSVSIMVEDWGSSHSTGHAIIPQRTYYLPINNENIPMISEIRPIGNNRLNINNPVEILISPVANGQNVKINDDPDEDLCINLGQIRYGRSMFLELRINPFSEEGLQIVYPDTIEVDILLQNPSVNKRVDVPEDLPEPSEMESDDNPPIPLWNMNDYSPIPQPADSGSYTNSHPPIQMAIITTSAMNSSLQDLAEWKTQRGVYTSVYEMEWIYTNVSGSDNESRIRNLLTDLWDNEDLQFALLGGDHADVPSRMAYVPDTYQDTGSDGSYVPTDAYYSDLDGSGHTPYDWDGDNDGRYGEYSVDKIDLIPEIYIGRLSASNSSQMSNLVNNIINYENNPPNGSWFNRSILAASYSNYDTKDHPPSNDTTDEADMKEAIRTRFINESKIDVYRLYEKAGIWPSQQSCEANLTLTNMVNAIDNGSFMVNMAGHGSSSGIYRTIWDSDSDNDGYCDPGEYSQTAFYTSSVTQTNGGKKPLFYNNACNNGEFDRRWSLTEDILRDVGIGAVGAARVSWYSVHWTPGSDGGYYNQGHDYRFWEQFFDGNYQPGKALYKSKYDYINDKTAHNTQVWKNLLQYNLIGDPEINIWTQQPDTFNVTYSDPIPAPGNYTFQIKDSSGDPVEGARICLMNNSNFYGYCDTNESGYGWIQIPEITMNVTLTVTGHNFKPFQKEVSTFVEYYEHSVISIDNNSGFNEANGVRSGNGTKENPYVIEGWRISAVGYGRGIYIGNTSSYAVIKDCYIEDASGIDDDYYFNTGINLFNSTNVSIINNIFTGNYIGILSIYSDQLIVEGNIVNSNLHHGIYILDSDDNKLRNNTCIENGYYGIYLKSSENNTVVDNNCSSNSYYGLMINSNSNNNTIQNNIAENQTIGLYIYSSYNNTVLNNTYSGNDHYGIYLYHCHNTMFDCNTINDNGAFGIYTLNSDENLLKYNNCDNNSKYGMYLRYSDNNIISNNSCDYNSQYGIQIRYSNENILQYNTFNFNEIYGIYIRSSDENLLIENNCLSNMYNGILVYSNSISNVIQNNTCTDQMFGIYLHNSDYNEIINNNLSNNTYYGLYSYLSDKSNITGNRIIGNGYDGIYMIYSDNNSIVKNLNENNERYGIYVRLSSFNYIDNNSFSYNKNTGLYLLDSDNNQISNNSCRSNIAYGIYIRSSKDNKLIVNNCSLNKYYGIFVYSNSISNIIQNNTCTDQMFGIYLHTSDNNEIESNNFSNNNYYGLYSYLSDRSNITGNIASHNGYDGMYLANSNYINILKNINNNNNRYGLYFLLSNNNTVKNNIFSEDNKTGLYLYKSDDNQVNNNTCESNREFGISVRNSDRNIMKNNTLNSNDRHGLFLRSSMDNIIKFNNCSFNNYCGILIYSNSQFNIVNNNTFNDNYFGIYIHTSDNNTVTWNEIYNNSYYGLYIYDSNYNLVHHNAFIDNHNGSIQAKDLGYNNDWDEGSQGNYWNDYTSIYPNAINDGTIWYTSYSIYGTAGSNDTKPLVNKP